jgi:hypothetical protein
VAQLLPLDQQVIVETGVGSGVAHFEPVDVRFEGAVAERSDARQIAVLDTVACRHPHLRLEDQADAADTGTGRRHRQPGNAVEPRIGRIRLHLAGTLIGQGHIVLYRTVHIHYAWFQDKSPIVLRFLPASEG